MGGGRACRSRYTSAREVDAGEAESATHRGIEAAGDSGLGVWVPFVEEAAAVSELLVRGWAVSPGERYRFRSAPGIRITTSDLQPEEAERLADAFAARGRTTGSTYAG